MKTMIGGLLLATGIMAAISAAARDDRRPACDEGTPADRRFILAVTAKLAGMLTTGDPAPLQHHLDPQAL